jgi:hypothetical protein
MTRTTMRRGVMVVVLLGVFGLGYVCGVTNQHRADAQGLGGVLEQAGKMGGRVGAVGQLGSSIVEMQGHITGLQKNLDALKTVQAALTGK